MSFKALKIRIKKNEGFSKTPYKDQLGFYTIGYGHLIKTHEKNYFNKKYNKKHFEELFQLDFQNAVNQYEKLFTKAKHNNNDKELLIEMLFQLGPKGVLGFKKMLFYLEKKKKYMVCFEMMNSLWYKQTPNRVEDIINNFIKKK